MGTEITVTSFDFQNHLRVTVNKAYIIVPTLQRPREEKGVAQCHSWRDQRLPLLQGLRKGNTAMRGGKRFPSSLHSGFRGVEEGEKEKGRKKRDQKRSRGRLEVLLKRQWNKTSENKSKTLKHTQAETGRDY